MNRRVVVDMDGVLADFDGAFCLEFGYERRGFASLENRYPEHRREILKFINDGNVYAHLNPLQLGLDIVKWLNKNGFEVCIVTGRPFGFDSLSIGWLKRYGVKFSSYICERPKIGKIVNINPLCAVDDLFSIYKSLYGHCIPCILTAHEYNDFIGENMPRVATSDQFIQTFNELCPEI